MKDFNKSHDIAGQSNTTVQKSHKHDANLQKNSSLYFQVGLILCLLGTYAMFEMKFEAKADEFVLVLDYDEDLTYDHTNYVVEPIAPEVKPVVRKKQQVITQTIKVVDDITPTPPVDIVTTPPVISKPVANPTPPKKVEPTPPTNTVYTTGNVQVVPVYPGCEKEKTNNDRIKCMNEKLAKLIQRKFNTDLAQELGLSGKQRINVQFKIDQNGMITDILTRAPHPKLEKEAERVTNKIPQMVPGLQSDKPVSVVYHLPIVFSVNN